jgi:hypothetical protein
MVAAFYICLFIFIQHIKSKRSSDSESIDVDFLYSIMLNICSLWGGAICFGRPYLPVTIYSLGIFVIIILSQNHLELAKWIEKLSVILSVLSLIFEHFLFAFKYWIKHNLVCFKFFFFLIRKNICLKLLMIKEQLLNIFLQKVFVSGHYHHTISLCLLCALLSLFLLLCVCANVLKCDLYLLFTK